MVNLKNISNKVFGTLDERSFVVYYCADLNDISPRICSPFNEEWFWAYNTKDLINYIFEIIVANYLVNDVVAFGKVIIENKFDFLMAIDIYNKYKKINKSKKKAINILVDLYNNNINKELCYFDFVKLLISIEDCSPNLGIDLKFESFSTPLEARHSKNIIPPKFDFNNLLNNF